MGTYWKNIFDMWCDQRGIFFFDGFLLIIFLLYNVDAKSYVFAGATQQITWIYKFKLTCLWFQVHNSVVGVHWFPLRLGITLLFLSNCFQAIVSYWGEALQGKTWLPMKISIYLSIWSKICNSITHHDIKEAQKRKEAY